jgi:hypothetical protein
MVVVRTIVLSERRGPLPAERRVGTAKKSPEITLDPDTATRIA